MKLKIELDGHRFYEPVFKQIAAILDKNYEIKYDSTDDAIGLSFTVIHKKYKYHGLHIKTYLNEIPEWTIAGYYDLPIRLGGVSKYEFTPEMDEENFPLLTKPQLTVIETKIKAINKRTIMDIKSYGNDAENGLVGLNIHDVIGYEDGALDLRGFENYGIVIDYASYLLHPSPKMLSNYRKVQGVIKSKDPKVREFTEVIFDMYIEAVKMESADTALKSMTRFNRNECSLFTEGNEINYIEMVKSMYPFDEGYVFISDLDSWMVDRFIHLTDNKNIKTTLDHYFYMKTNDNHFISEEAKEMFLF